MKVIGHEFSEGKTCLIGYDENGVVIEFHRPFIDGERENLPTSMVKWQSACTFAHGENAVTIIRLSHEAANVLCSGLLKMIEERNRPKASIEEINPPSND